jgi:hypothetical protein
LVQLAAHGLFSGPIEFRRLLAYRRSSLYKCLYALSASLFVVFGWNRVFTENHEKFNNSALIVFRKFFYSLSGFLRGYDLKQVRTNLAI